MEHTITATTEQLEAFVATITEYFEFMEEERETDPKGLPPGISESIPLLKALRSKCLTALSSSR